MERVTGAADIGGTRLAYEMAGSGPALVLVHEGICDMRMWDPQVEPLVAAGRRVVRYDLRGYGSSTLPPGRFSHVGDLRGLLDALEIHSAAVVGVSVGGRIALELALVQPELVEALVLVGAGLRDWDWSPEVRKFGEQEEALLDRGDVDAAVELNLRTWVDGPERAPSEVDHAVRERVREMQRRAFDIDLAAYEQDPPPGPEDPLDPPATARLAELSAPTLVLVGEKDQPDILRIADVLADGIPTARKVVIPDTAHVPSMEKPDEFNRLLLDFLNES
jgi:pimeloyl-ACP methyl ester carboxylesterase